MALFPWRFQAEVPNGESNPLVTVFMGPERASMDDAGEPTGDTFVQQDTSDPVQIPLSELPAALANPSVLVGLRKKRAPMKPATAG
jgi:hypothetical protein